MTSYNSIPAAMPGAFSFETTLPPKLDVNVGAKSHIFQPPKTPSASSSLYKSGSVRLDRDDGSTTSRKRSRQDSTPSGQTRPHSITSHAWSDMAYDSPSTLDTPGAQSPAPFVNTQYTLADGLDTPTAAMASAMDRGDYRDSPELHLRAGRGFRGFDVPETDAYFPHATSALSREGNGRPRLPTSPGIRDGLGRAVYRVAGKVWEFCRTSAFRGFYAGGGQGYEMKTPVETFDGEQGIWQEVEADDVFRRNSREDTPVPGRFPEEDFISDYMSRDHTTPPRAAKRIQREKGTGEMGASWVMVGSAPTSRDTSPSRMSSRKVPSMSSSTRRPIPKLGRRPILPASRPSQNSYAASPRPRSNGPASYASPRSPSPKHDSPVSVEVQRHAARMRKRELKEDANLKRFNEQLQAMIKEGKEALGTKFEVEDNHDEPLDEGCARGENLYAREKG